MAEEGNVADADVDARRTVEALVEGDVLAEVDDGYRVSPTFVDAVDRIQAEVSKADEAAVRERVAGTVDDEDRRALVVEVGLDDREFLAAYLALSDALPGLPAGTRIRTVPMLQQFRDAPPREEGAPRAFVPIHGDTMRTVTRLFPRSIVYVWLDDCEPCDGMRATFDELFSAPPEGIELFAVYGPDYARYLHEQYDVKGGPVTLFMLRDEVDARFYGERADVVVESEVEMLRDADP